MYSKEEATKLREQFWISFGQYMKPVPAASGTTVNWVNYKTGVKNIYFKTEAGHKNAFIAIQLTHSDPEIRHLIFNQFEEFKTMFHHTMPGEWDWFLDFTDTQGKQISQIVLYLDKVSVFNRQHWPELISFFKSGLIALDDFWDSVKPVFEDLV